MREGTRTVLSMQNNYEGPPEKFAMIVPVPVVLQKENVKTLPRALFEKLEQLDAPRLVEYWEQDPCAFEADEKELKKAIMGIKTDSTPVEDPKDPAKDTVFTLYALFASPDEREALAARYRAGGMGYGEAKKLLLEKAIEHFAPYRRRRAELLASPAEVDAVLREGAARARAVARATLEEVRVACGLA